ncbi:MAG TPA: cell division protein FtsZ [Desulfobacteraceae bacterium]|nr:cell division protein FtsZ [Desulfobacteraceae bacterium]
MKFEFVDEKERYTAKIKVMGIGGAGGNAINNMINSKLDGVDFIVANTDCQDIDRSLCSYRLQLGPSVTRGLGAGADPEIGKLSAEESIKEIREAVEGSDMIFITAGMGGGTGTGASPVIAHECKESGALTVAVATKPFSFEGGKRMNRALEGIEELKKEVDSLIIIPNERLKSLNKGKFSFKDLIAQADEVLLRAVRGISDLIMSKGFINLDFADVKKVMDQTGTAIMGMGKATGEKRALEAAQEAINSPLLEDISINSAKGLLMNITGPSDITMDEIDEASNHIRSEVPEDTDIFWGVVFDDTIGDEVRVTVIATGIDAGDNEAEYSDAAEFNNVVKIRDLTPDEAKENWTVRKKEELLDAPAYQREGKELSAAINDSEPETREVKKGIFSKFHFKDSLDYPTFLRNKAEQTTS